MDDSSIKMSISDIVMPITQEKFFHDLAVKSGILRCFPSEEILFLTNLSDETEIVQLKRNKLEILAITDTQVYTKII